MKSVSGKNWVEKKINKNLLEKIKQDFNFNEILAKLIVSRNFDKTEIFNIDNDLEISNIFINNKDFKIAADILIESIDNKEKICILGDYDVDGNASTALFVRFFEFIKHPYFYYIPDREKDGYGASIKIFEKLILKKPKLVIMVDCGSTSNDAINFLNKKSIKSIIIDHHEINKPFPRSNIIINPKKNDGYEKYTNLCATALTYFFLDLVIKKKNYAYKLNNYLIYVLLATVCDVMPLRKINRILAINILKNYNVKKNISINTIFRLKNKKNKITIDDLGFMIGPIINSAGRLGASHLSVKLLSSENQNIVNEISERLIRLNDKRKEIEKKILDKINFKKIEKENKNVIIYYNPNIKEGLIGIIASRLKDYFNKPAIVITRSNNVFKGSARSTKNYNIGNLIKLLCDKKIIQSGGGHNMAAGLIIKKEKIKLLDNFIQNDYSKKVLNLINFLEYDAELSSSSININLINNIYKLYPFGNDNPLPLFLFKRFKILKTTVLDNRHISAILKPNLGTSIKTICYNCINTDLGNYLLSYKNQIDIIAQVSLNTWNNKKSVQLNIKDVFI
ncbi:single-stranded-DNA-specific exonuclease RecJ [Candidatus Pelagibacter bacterium]|nr:single-stranded-DNA-specific exonuclease RecJ [Candidatus Pelagibacter bacterium]